MVGGDKSTSPGRVMATEMLVGEKKGYPSSDASPTRPPFLTRRTMDTSEEPDQNPPGPAPLSEEEGEEYEERYPVEF